jgi:hypothetical protein
MRPGPTKVVVPVAGEPPRLLDRVNQFTDPAFAGDPAGPRNRSAGGFFVRCKRPVRLH